MQAGRGKKAVLVLLRSSTCTHDNVDGRACVNKSAGLLGFGGSETRAMG